MIQLFDFFKQITFKEFQKILKKRKKNITFFKFNIPIFTKKKFNDNYFKSIQIQKFLKKNSKQKFSNSLKKKYFNNDIIKQRKTNLKKFQHYERKYPKRCKGTLFSHVRGNPTYSKLPCSWPHFCG